MSDDDEDTKSEQGDIVGERRAYEKESDRSDSGLGVATNNYEEVYSTHYMYTVVSPEKKYSRVVPSDM